MELRPLRPRLSQGVLQGVLPEVHNPGGPRHIACVALKELPLDALVQCTIGKALLVVSSCLLLLESVPKGWLALLQTHQLQLASKALSRQ